MISYLYVENGQTTSYVAFYNFGDEGQGEIDNIVAGFTYEGVVVPHGSIFGRRRFQQLSGMTVSPYTKEQRSQGEDE